ncbi:MAG: RecX family transcriptional regulator [Bacteroidetes bacterium]|nr:RecX family transcriptional regulator [Bacteroidota bacterium]
MAVSKKLSPGLSPDTAVLFRKAADYCVIQDRCRQEIITKLTYWGADRDESDSILERLNKEGFLDEKRFAVAYARGKFRNLNWGRIRIIMELKRRNIPQGFISLATEEIDQEEYIETIGKLFRKKMKELRSDTKQNRLKAMRFLAGKGFELDLIRKFAKEE